jgi:hypothetical protein
MPFYNRNINITNWRGRLGNNIIQISNAIYIAEKTKSTVFFPSLRHRGLNLNTISFSEDPPPLGINTIKGDFWEIDKFDSCYRIKKEELISNRRRILLAYFNPIITTQVKVYKFYPDNPTEKDLTLHIRGSDIFNKQPHPDYVPPPLIYYSDVIESREYENVFIISEDTKNPCISELKKRFGKKIKVIHEMYSGLYNQSQNLKCEHPSRRILNDFYFLMKSKNLVCGNSTFSLTAALCSDCVNDLWIPGHGTVEIDENYRKQFGFNINIMNYKNYIKTGEWRNSKEQIEMVLNYH